MQECPGYCVAVDVQDVLKRSVYNLRFKKKISGDTHHTVFHHSSLRLHSFELYRGGILVLFIYTGLFISPSGISDPCGTVAGMVTPKGSMSTEGETLQVSVLPYRCSIVDF